jgi:AraC family transcriptional regulator
VSGQPAKTNPDSPLIFKRRAAWEGIRIEHYRFHEGTLPEHHHREHVLIMPVGAGCNGELRTANGFRLRGSNGAGGVCLVPAGLGHRAQLEGPSEYLTVYLDPAVITRAAAAAYVSGTVEIIEKYSAADTVIRNVGMALLAEFQCKGVGGQLYVDSLANVLAVHLLRYYTAAGSAFPRRAGGLSGKKLSEVTSFMAENCTRDVRLEELAQVAGISRFHFAREFKKVTGASPHQYLMKLRIQRAKSLLQGSNLPLIDVGLQSGFSHQSHFTRLFRRFTGTTPQSYRLLVQQ